MIRLRVIPINQLSAGQILNLAQFGFTLVHRATSIEVWIERAACRA
jgi:hypothetical protein